MTTVGRRRPGPYRHTHLGRRRRRQADGRGADRPDRLRRRGRRHARRGRTKAPAGQAPSTRPISPRTSCAPASQPESADRRRHERRRWIAGETRRRCHASPRSRLSWPITLLPETNRRPPHQQLDLAARGQVGVEPRTRPLAPPVPPPRLARRGLSSPRQPKNARPRAPSLPSLGRPGQPERGEREGVAGRDNELMGGEPDTPVERPESRWAELGLRAIGRMPPGRRPRRLPRRAGSCSGSRRSAPRPSPSRSSRPPPATSRRSGRASRRRSATTSRRGARARSPRPGRAPRRSSSAAPPGA